MQTGIVFCPQLIYKIVLQQCYFPIRDSSQGIVERFKNPANPTCYAISSASLAIKLSDQAVVCSAE
ncbi:MAG: hypothetical protein OFPI_23180 [Osedax symbiont Rs2]|nr:MAG: hypothetical protein OFPI_23180 [Osedax symbiont Rs2]